MAFHHSLVFLTLFLLFIPKFIASPSQTRSMCVSQISLANQACIILPVLQESADEADDTLMLGLRDGDDGHGHTHGHKEGDEHSPDEESSPDEDEERSVHVTGSHHRHRKHGHGNRREAHHDKDSHNRRRRHHHQHHHHNHLMDASRNCCRWLEQVDNICVCEIIAHLPKFMTRPRHHYTVMVDGMCEVSFDCSGI